MWRTIASSILLPATRIDCETTMPPSEITATSVVPPPMSTTMLPDGPSIGKPGADRGRHRLFDDVDDLRAGELGRIAHGAFFDRRDLGRHADHDRRLRAGTSVDHHERCFHHLLDEVGEHRFGDFEVGDDAVAQRPDRLDVAPACGRASGALPRRRQASCRCARPWRRPTARATRCPCPCTYTSTLAVPRSIPISMVLTPQVAAHWFG